MILKIAPLLVLIALIPPVSACCTAWRSGAAPVRIAAQEVLIVWDEEQKMEHFIRRANFQADQAPDDFGFLVPTPTQPKLSEVPDAIFDDLGDIIKPKIKIEKKTEISFMPLSLLFFTATMGTKDSESVALKRDGIEILDRAFVGGFEAVVLRASDTEGLLQWLDKNDYDARPALRDWLTPYVEKKWIVTAFKYANDPKAGAPSLSRASVCLSFETEAPFFPYRVPSDIRVKPENGALLRLYFAGQERVIGEFETDASWNPLTKFSDRDDKVSVALEKIGNLPESAPNSTWLTAFEDETWPGGAEDLYFVASPEKDTLLPPPTIRTKINTMRIPLDLVLPCLFLVGYLYKERAKGRATAD